MLLQVGSTPTLVVSSLEMAEEILKTQAVVFANRPPMSNTKKLFYGATDIGFSPYGPYWSQLRKFCVHELLSAKRVRSIRYISEEEVAITVDTISHSCKVGDSVNMTDLLHTLTNNLISRVALGKIYQDKDDVNSKLWKLVREVGVLSITASVEDYFPSLGWIDKLTGLDGRMKRVSKELDAFLDLVIEDHLTSNKDDRSQANQENFVDLLLQAHKDSTFNISLTRDNIKAIILGILTGATGITANTMECAMVELISKPTMIRKAQEEVRKVVGKKSMVQEGDILQMNYLKSIVKETLRLHCPPLLVPRESIEDTIVKGYHIPAKTKVLINAWAINRDPKLWDKPEEFIPERYSNSSTDFKGEVLQTLAFGAGQRGCPGSLFALASIELTLATLLYWFDWELAGNARKEGIDITEVSKRSIQKNHLYLLPNFHFS
ncbi:hypothetical protein NE237_015578 [Protea cynaroides]|uniref:Cytochrome P450 n=1 Tax=Protea cynaroides TaxID=273540 RepID=A0A9Q0QR61_9MAGN|nr:hypothetical protein NE237_015578 [Protea cynaroides]